MKIKIDFAKIKKLPAKRGVFFNFQLFGFFNNFRENFRVVFREIGEDFPIKFYFGVFQSGNQFTVR